MAAFLSSWCCRFVAGFRPCQQATKKGAHLSFHCLLYLRVLVNLCGNKHEKVCALKTQTFRLLVLPLKFTRFTDREQERKAQGLCYVRVVYLSLFLSVGLGFLFNYLSCPFRQLLHIFFRNDAVGKADEQLLLGIINRVVI